MKADFMLKLYISSGGTTVFQDQYIVSYYTIGNALVTNVGDNFRFTSRPQGTPRFFRDSLGLSEDSRYYYKVSRGSLLRIPAECFKNSFNAVLPRDPYQ